MRNARKALLTSLFLVETAACQSEPPPGPAQRSAQPRNTTNVVRAETYARGLVHPWALAFLPDGRLLVTERPGRLRIVARDGSLSPPLAGVPAVHARGQGGLLDVAIDPRFAENQLVYLSYAEPGEGGTAGTAVARGRLTASGLADVRVIYRQHPKVVGSGHFGSRLVFARDGKLFVTMGDRQSEDHRDQAQALSSEIGKIVRLNADGSVPGDNPYAGRTGARPAIWSYGHRNIQAAALHPETGELWEIEHGPQGGDELNRPVAGRNYGWPVITYGREYSGRRVGEGLTQRQGMEQPVFYWDPVIAPSGMIFYTGDAFAGWKGSILVGSLAPGGLVRLTMRDGRVTGEERHLGELNERIRDVQQGPDGLLYVVTDSPEGRVLKLSPAR